MAKRFTDTNKWKKEFIRGLQGAYKLLWLYLLDECDHAGIWHVEIDVAAIRISETLSQKEAIKQFGDRIQIIDGGNKWFIPDFIEFQYGELNPANRAHKSVLDQLNKYKDKGLTWPLQGCKDMDMDKDMDKDTIPAWQEFLEYAKEKEPQVSEKALKLKYDSWVENGWKTGGKKPHKIQNWKTTLLNTLPYIEADTKQRNIDDSKFNDKTY